MEINICFVCGNKEVKDVAVTIVSALLHSSTLDTYTIYVIEWNISRKNKKKLYKLKNIRDFNLVFIRVSENELADYSAVKNIQGISLKAYLIFKIPSLISYVDKILYLDSRMLVKEDVSGLYNTNTDKFFAAAIPEPDNQKHKLRLNILGDNYYVNVSVFLFNCKKWKHESIEKQLFKYIQNPAHSISFFVQDVLNDVLKYKIKYLPINWNFLPINGNLRVNSLYLEQEEARIAEYPYIVNFSCVSEYELINIGNDLTDEYFAYLACTPFRFWNINPVLSYLFRKLILLMRNISSIILQKSIANMQIKNDSNNYFYIRKNSTYDNDHSAKTPVIR